MNIRLSLPDHAITTIPALALLVTLHFVFFADHSPEPSKGIELSAPVYSDHLYRQISKHKIDVDSKLNQLGIVDTTRDKAIRELLGQKNFKEANTQLLEVSAAAVERNDLVQLNDALLLLGEVAIHQQELSAAEIYLQEALYLAMSRNDTVASARSYQQLGYLNIKARALARQASTTHDKLWQARNLTARGLFHGVDQSIDSVIKDNLAIKRFGAAADAWEARASLFDQMHDSYQAQQSRIEAARLYASTGQVLRARTLLQQLDRQQISEIELSMRNDEIDDLFERHQQDLVQTSQARDYQMLFHHYQRSGDIKQAWKFRIQASQTLAKTTERSMFQRQADVIAVLYNSNFAMERARNYLEQAGDFYGSQGDVNSIAQTRLMESLIY